MKCTNCGREFNGNALNPLDWGMSFCCSAGCKIEWENRMAGLQRAELERQTTERIRERQISAIVAQRKAEAPQNTWISFNRLEDEAVDNGLRMLRWPVYLFVLSAMTFEFDLFWGGVGFIVGLACIRRFLRRRFFYPALIALFLVTCKLVAESPSSTGV